MNEQESAGEDSGAEFFRGDGHAESESVVDLSMFRFVLKHELRKAVRLSYCVSILCLGLDVERIQEQPALCKRVADCARALLRATDLVTMLPAYGVAILLVDAPIKNLGPIFRRITDAVAGLSSPKTGPALTLSAGASCYPYTASNDRELLHQAADLMKMAKNHGGNRLYSR